MLKTRFSVTLCCVAFLLSIPVQSLLAGEEALPDKARPIRPAISNEEKDVIYPIIDGSTSAQPLGMLIACRRLGVDCGWQPVHYSMFRPFGDGEAMGQQLTLSPFARLQSVDSKSGPDVEAHKNAAMKVRIVTNATRHFGTHRSIVNVIQGNAALALTARKPSADELQIATDWHVKLTCTPVALDAFVFVRHKDNPVTNLTSGQIRKIYTHDIKNWQAAGGPDLEIHPYQRNATSGSQVLMQTLVMKDVAMAPGVKPLMSMDMMGVFHQMHHDKQGLAYSVYFFERFMTAETNTRLLSVDGVLPSYETIRSGAYPYATKVYAVARTDLPEDHPAHELREWLQTDEGQAVIAESGYVPLPETATNAQMQQVQQKK